MTFLHQAVHHGNTNIVGQVFKWVGGVHWNSDSNPKDKEVSDKVVDYMVHDENGLTPFHEAFACGNLWEKNLEFLKKSTRSQKIGNILEGFNGFLHRPLLEAIVFDCKENYIPLVFVK